MLSSHFQGRKHIVSDFVGGPIAEEEKYIFSVSRIEHAVF
jgi:hypothetical protein